MKKLIFFSMMFLTSIVTQAQLTSYGGLIMGGAGQTGSATSSFFGTDAGMNSNSPTGVNTFIGWNAGRETEGGYKNTFVGGGAGLNNIGGYENTFVGSAAGIDNVGIKNVFFGVSAGRFNAGGSYNTYIGSRAGYSNVTGANNVFLGNKAGYNELGSNLLYIDNSDTATPLIYGDFANDILGLNARVGIGTQTPSSELQVTGNNPAITLTNVNGATLQLASAEVAGNYTPFSIAGDQVIRMLGSANIIFSTSASTGAGRAFKFVSGNNFLMEIDDTGKVRIGDVTTPGQYKLYVKDGILAEKVKVANVAGIDWADYVFEEEYDRNTTEEVEQFIKKNKHLPNVPSAKEVSENGVDMVEMDATLLRQIEELWLHVIELKKENELLKNEVESLRK